MSKKNHNNDISPEELLEQLRSSIELDETGMTAEIDIPTIPEVNQMSAQERFMARRNAAIEAEAAEEIAPEEPEAEEPVTEEPKSSDTREIPAVESEEKPETETTQEFNRVEPKVEDEVEVTSEFDAVAEESSEVDIDALMKKYLSDAEYQEVLRTRRETEDPELALHISEAEEYVSSIESEIEKSAPAEPVTETQKVLQEMEIPHMTDDDEVLDETDINLMIAFGMQEELEEKLGDETAQVIEEAVRKDAENFAQIKREDNIPDEIDENMEYTHASQIKDVFNIYKKQHRNLLIKIFAAIGALAVVFLFENLSALGGSYPMLLDPQVFPVIHIMASLQLLTLSCALVIRPILDGFKGLFTGKPTADSVLSVTVLVAIAYHIGACFVYDGSPMLLCNTPTVLCILLSLVSRMYTLKRDIFSFNIVSSKRVKYTVARMADADTVMEHEAFDEYIDEDSSVFRVTKTSFVDNFFKRTRTYSKNKAILSALLPICLCLAAFFVVFVGLFRNDWFAGIRCGYLVMMLAAPATAFITYSYPLYRASKVAFEMGSAIVGEESLEEYSNAGAVSFDDKDVFPSQKTKVTSIKIYGNNRIDKVIYNVASLFKVLGGPLCDVFNIATKDFECSDDVEIVDIAEDGIEAVISGKHIFYGKASYLHRNNFEPVTELNDERIEFTGEACIAYLVCNDEVAAKLYISYGIDPDFITISKQLYRAGMCIGIKSFDPNIDDALLGKHINMSKYAVKVLKCRFLSEKTATEERGDSGIVSKKSPKSLLKTLALCDRVNSVMRGSIVIKLLSILLAFGITVFIMFKGVSTFDFAGAYAALYQLFWMIPIFGISLINIKK
ncbi:MAG: hypothetical protein IJB24_03985 [Clostridia bacterium]|nr:hypothetical protein [Clostridia bacterium]